MLRIPIVFLTTSLLGSASPGAKALSDYLAEEFPARIVKVAVGANHIRIEGTTGGLSGQIQLADIPMDVVLGDARCAETRVDVQPDAAGRFSLELPRLRQRDGRHYDRLLSRWQVTAADGRPLSHARHADQVECRSPDLKAARPADKKGLGGWSADRLPDELDDLGISAVTVNLVMEHFLAPAAEPGTAPIEWQGRTFHLREDRLARMDATFRKAAESDVMVSVILLIGNPSKSADPVVKVLGHADAVPAGIFAMPAVTSEEGLAMYGALLNALAERWSRPDGKFGRVHHWIMHNEVDAGWEWTNAGDKPAIVYMDLYQRSMRLAWLIAAQYDPHARPFISLTHHWAWHGAEHWYGSKVMLELLVEFCEAEGDFPWGVAYHPYPQDLHQPRTWEDDQATFDFNSRKITPKNLEVLDAYMKQPEMRHRGKVRPVHLSENGFNSPDYSDSSLAGQAAGMAMAWKKIAALSSIESWQYHNWIDNRGEGGLRIGLRKFPDDPADPLGRKPIWFLYQALGTPREDAVAQPYLKTIGISSWDEVIHRGPIR